MIRIMVNRATYIYKRGKGGQIVPSTVDTPHWSLVIQKAFRKVADEATRRDLVRSFCDAVTNKTNLTDSGVTVTHA